LNIRYFLHYYNLIKFNFLLFLVNSSPSIKHQPQYQDHCLETRQRSLSVGNDSACPNRHLQLQQPPVGHPQPQSLNHKSASGSPPLGVGGGGDMMLDGVQLRQPRPHSLTPQQHQQQNQQQQQQQRKSAECWKSALNRNDLISIIRESMEKNRLCFQLNG